MRHIISGIVWFIAGLYLVLILLLQFPATQGLIGTELGMILSNKFGTEVRVGKVNLGFFNRLIIDDVCIKDQQGENMFTASRLSAKIRLIPLLTQGTIRISSAQVFGGRAMLYQESAETMPNFQFMLDSLSSKDTSRHSPLDLQVSSLVIRHGAVSYDRRDIPPTHHFNTDHFHLTGVSGHFMLNILTNDSLNLHVKRLAFQEEGGFQVKSFSALLKMGKHHASLEEIDLQLPHSHISFADVDATYRHTKNGISWPSITFKGKVNPSIVTPSDLAYFTNGKSIGNIPLHFELDFTGTYRSIAIRHLALQTKESQLTLNGSGSIQDWDKQVKWGANIKEFTISNKELKNILSQLRYPDKQSELISRIGELHFTGSASGMGDHLFTQGTLHTDAGSIVLSLEKHKKHFVGHVKSNDYNIQKILNDDRFGRTTTELYVNGSFRTNNDVELNIQGHTPYIEYGKYTFHNINYEASYHDHRIDGILNMNDPNGHLTLNGSTIWDKQPAVNLQADLHQFNPSAMKLTNLWPDTRFGCKLHVDVHGNDLATASGIIDIQNFHMKSPKTEYHMDNLHIEKEEIAKGNILRLSSDFATLSMNGKYDLTTLGQSLINILRAKLPTIPWLPPSSNAHSNDFAIHANISRTDWLPALLGIPLNINSPIQLDGQVNDRSKTMNVACLMPSFHYAGELYENAQIYMNMPNDTLKAVAQVDKIMDNGKRFSLKLYASAEDNKLLTDIYFRDNGVHPFKGHIDTETNFFKDEHGNDAAHVNIHPSEFAIADSVWHVEPSDVVYSKNRLIIDHFAIHHHHQYVYIAGNATKNPNDSVFIDFKDIDLGYILYLVNFHSVDFNGLASGRICISNAFATPQVSTDLSVHNFLFEQGRMGTLHALANFNQEKQQIDIQAIAEDPDINGRTLINGFISPSRNTIDLDFQAQNTRLEFMESLCGSFMGDVEASARGNVKLSGPLNQINLTGQLIADGRIHMKSLNTDYTLRTDTITFIPDEIILRQDTIYDRHGHIGIVNGNIHHKHLTRLSYDLDIDAQHLLAYDTHEFGEDTFYGTAYATGNCTIKGKSGEVNIDVNATTEPGSIIVYNAASPDALRDGEFIHWTERTSTLQSGEEAHTDLSKEEMAAPPQLEIPSDLHLNFVINCTPEATLRVIMDEQTGDYIDLNGTGMLRVSYYDKGSFDIYGNYNVDHGIYKLTIQNVIKKEFQFQPGGYIAFGGDPYNATLRLNASYMINSVPLSDLNIGRSFTSNNIRVNCLMNIQGTPAQPTVDFSFDMPTVGADAQQMIMSLINSEEEMNQQVLYLLAVGRFLNQGSNNAASEDASASQQSQTSLAMQSILSGTLSQQINNILSNVVNNPNWSLGANISTGDEGFNNAQYEGLLSGRLLNNRLLINGEFGYRDNTNATTSFIGDFDLRYLIYPNGNLALKFYNQTNDRYFAKNSLNTQGVGLIWKKDFNGWRELFRRKKKGAK